MQTGARACHVQNAVSTLLTSVESHTTLETAIAISCQATRAKPAASVLCEP
jgi:hypothetical protein